ncbi:MAG TPA: adenylate/guanylate cyclase domain-containing protein [Gaiellaceae bacterium]|nr:adenylate/guanylate cyclase domain-containing protein [Gaiellaceae bacterium]
MAVSRRTVTVLFADVADSTPLGERLDAESLRQVMSRWFEGMSDVLERHGGTVEKFIGDAVMAVFGIPELHEDDALRAVRAATELRTALAQLNDQLESELGIRIGIRVGVNTGEVVAGDGAGGQMLVTGDPVNVAKRLEEAARTGEILVGDGTRRLVENAALLEPRDELTVKGKSGPVVAWNVLGVIEGAPAYARRLDAPLVGRTEELRVLHDAFASAVGERVCRLVTLVGPAGIGKSRLSAEFCQGVGDQARVLTGRCLPYGDGITFWPLVQIVGALGSDDGVRSVLAAADDGALVAERVLGAVGPTSTSVPGGETFWAVRRLLEELAREQPLVVLVEDIHWAAPTLLDLLEYLAGWTHDAPILLLCLARAELLEDRPGWLTATNSTAVVLQPLTDAEADALIDEIAQEWPLEAQARERIKEAAEGNPLYVEQMIAMLAEGEPGDSIPPSIHALLAARLDRLPPEERSILERAAIAGKEFVRSAVLQLSDEVDRAQVDALLLRLARKDLLTAKPGREDAYRFRHVLIRDAAYAGTPKELRAELHERFAGWAARTNAGRAGELDEIVGYHYEQAFRYREQLGPLDDRARSLADLGGSLLGAAGRRAFARDDTPAAVNLLDRALALATEEDPARLELMRQLSSALWSLGEVTRAESLLNGLVDAAAAAGDRRYELYGALQQSSWRGAREPEAGWHETAAIAEEAIRVFEELGDDVGLAQAWRQLAATLGARGTFADSVEACERALKHARLAAAAREESRSADLLCMGLLHGPAPVEHAIERATAMLHRASSNALLQANVTAALAELKAMQSDFDDARALCLQARLIYESLGLRLGLAGLTQVAGLVELLAGDATAAEQTLREGHALLAGITGMQGYHGLLLAEALSEQGRDEEARRLVEDAVALSRSPELETQVAWRLVKAPLLARAGDAREAEKIVRKAVSLVEQTDGLNLQGRAQLALADVLRIAGDSDQAAKAVRAAVSLFEQKGNAAAAARAERLLPDASPR